MSLTSCYRYIIELPVATLADLLRAALSESDGAATRQWTGIPIGGYTADVNVQPNDLDADPPTLDLLPTDLDAVLHLKMQVEVKILEIAELDKIDYEIAFDLKGVFAKDQSTPPQLLLQFPAVTAPSLNLTLAGGEIALTPELIEPRIHDAYDADPALGHTVLNNQPWVDLGTGQQTTVMVTVDIYDDDPSSMGFRGAITVQIVSATKITLEMPGHFRVQGISKMYVDTEMTVDVAVAVTQTDGKITARLADVTAGDVTVAFATSSIYDAAAIAVLQGQIASHISAMPNVVQTLPSQADITTLIEDRIVGMAGTLAFPVFTPREPAANDEIDLTTFVATTVAQQVLALQLEPLGDGTPCDTPDVFAHATGFALAVSAARVKEELDGLVADNKGTTRSMQGHDVTVEALSLSLEDPGEHGEATGHVWVDGTASAEVDCWADPEVDFWGPITLNPTLEPDGTIKVTADAGTFGADDPCCADVDPQDIAAVIEGDSRSMGNMPTDFTGVGQLELTLESCDISRAGLVIHGGLKVTTLSTLSVGDFQALAYWFNEPAGGG